MSTNLNLQANFVSLS